MQIPINIHLIKAISYTGHWRFITDRLSIQRYGSIKLIFTIIFNRMTELRFVFIFTSYIPKIFLLKFLNLVQNVQ